MQLRLILAAGLALALNGCASAQVVVRDSVLAYAQSYSDQNYQGVWKHDFEYLLYMESVLQGVPSDMWAETSRRQQARFLQSFRQETGERRGCAYYFSPGSKITFVEARPASAASGYKAYSVFLTVSYPRDKSGPIGWQPGAKAPSMVASTLVTLQALKRSEKGGIEVNRSTCRSIDERTQYAPAPDLIMSDAIGAVLSKASAEQIEPVVYVAAKLDYGQWLECRDEKCETYKSVGSDQILKLAPTLTNVMELIGFSTLRPFKPIAFGVEAEFKPESQLQSSILGYSPRCCNPPDVFNSWRYQPLALRLASQRVGTKAEIIARTEDTRTVQVTISFTGCSAVCNGLLLAKDQLDRLSPSTVHHLIYPWPIPQLNSGSGTFERRLTAVFRLDNQLSWKFQSLQ